MVQSNESRMIRSNFDRRSPKLPVETAFNNHPAPATATPIALAATECGANTT
jgi:hypothetical protein